MAAVSDQAPRPLLPLREVGPAYLETALQSEVAEWRRDLDWDFAPSADLVRRFLNMRALGGFALPGRSEAAGYAYHVQDDGKGLIGGLYVRPEYRTLDNENALIAAVLESMWRTPGIPRVEAQLLMLRSPLDRPVPYPRCFTQFPRKFLKIGLEPAKRFPVRRTPFLITGWDRSLHERAAHLIAAAYAAHIDGEINDQYRSVSGARRFLSNIVQYPGCGAFFQPGAFAAVDNAGTLCGICLTSLVADSVGHITQLCVAPEKRGTGLGYELLRRSLVALAEHGVQRASLTVTTANRSALHLYEHFGFTCDRDFAAYVWQLP